MFYGEYADNMQTNVVWWICKWESWEEALHTLKVQTSAAKCMKSRGPIGNITSNSPQKVNCMIHKTIEWEYRTLKLRTMSRNAACKCGDL